MTLVERIESLCDERAISIRKMERDANIGQGSVSKWKAGAYRPATTSVQRIAAYFGVSMDYLMGDSGEALSPEVIDHLKKMRHDASADPLQETSSVLIPVLGKVAAGTPLTAEEQILGYEDIPVEWTYAGDHFALRVKGDSMYPRICEGDVLIVRKQKNADSGDIVVVRVGEEDATVKRFVRNEGSITLQPFNTAYEPLVFTNKQIKSLPVTIIGRVVENRQKY
ncbi:MAG: helix-turn-helix domain-containing protein [Lachnospiraceae bacterium]|nr:helix-turn-helix domain-containing protein [Lachnospiraceae bacterium]